jgi:hypothetical protein
MGAALYPPPVAAPVTTTSGCVATTGFSVNNFFATKINGVATVKADIKVVTALNTGSSAPYNLADTVCCNIPDGYRPRNTMTALYSTGYADGECDITPDGDVTIRTTNTYNLAANDTVRFSATYVL